ncbi:hypothetical protein KC19_4G227300 [Ceratodon purpureus]|uniref:Cytochrome b561 and DOMON domain-containing protein n=1 Tax=Ceratodon purpureus TaxID=3225 RepID=A0A8T0IDR0_CERPU|nr:hypothetical protein KC19_4G227300 [Ceratodon purpureus]
MEMGKAPPRSSRVVWFYACVALILSIYTHKTSAAVTCRTDLATAANITIFPTDALQCMNSKFSPDNSGNVFVVWSLKDTATGFVSIVVSAPLAAKQWAALGFSGPGQMMGSTALVATLGAKGVNIDQYFLKDKVPSQVVRVNDRIKFTAGPESYYDNKYNIVYMAFQIDFKSSKAVPNFLLFAQGPASGADNGDLEYHTAQTYLPSEFAEGTVGESAASKLARKVKAHGAVQVFGWGVLLPIGAMVARYAKSFDPAWFYIHITFQTIGFIFIIAGLATGVDIAKTIDVPRLNGHKGLGFFLFTLAILQVLAVVARPHKEAKVRKYWNWYHWWVGRLALFLAVINIFVGISLNKGEPNAHNLKGSTPMLKFCGFTASFKHRNWVCEALESGNSSS